MLGALAVLQAERGEVAEAERLFAETRRKHRGTSPFPLARLACALSAAGHHREAEQWRGSAAARYDELALRHPDAFADHAADFRRQATGSNPTSRSARPAGPCPLGLRPTQS
jgi:hypothetical protein